MASGFIVCVNHLTCTMYNQPVHRSFRVLNDLNHPQNDVNKDRVRCNNCQKFTGILVIQRQLDRTQSPWQSQNPWTPILGYDDTGRLPVPLEFPFTKGSSLLSESDLIAIHALKDAGLSTSPVSPWPTEPVSFHSSIQPGMAPPLSPHYPKYASPLPNAGEQKINTQSGQSKV